MMSLRTRRDGTPAVPERFVWWCSTQLLRPFVARSAAVRHEGVSVLEATDRVIERALGPDPVPASRRDVLEVLSVGTLFLGGLSGLVGVLLGFAFFVSTGSTSGHLIIRGVAMLLTSPLLALGFVWAGRWSLARRDWRGGRPPRGSTPRDHDVLYAAPLAVLLAVFFAVV